MKIPIVAALTAGAEGEPPQAANKIDAPAGTPSKSASPVAATTAPVAKPSQPTAANQKPVPQACALITAAGETSATFDKLEEGRRTWPPALAHKIAAHLGGES